MKVELLTPDKENAYSAYLLKHDHSLFNASILFRDFIRTLCPDAIPYYFIALEEDEIVGVLPAFMKKGPLGPVLNSMPWYGSNPGVIADDDMAVITLLEAFCSTARWTNCFSSTFISPPNQPDLEGLYEAFFCQRDVFNDERIGMMTPLPVFGSGDRFANALLKQVHQKTRNQILKSVKGCSAYESYGPEDWKFLKDQHREGMVAVGGPVKDIEFDIIQKHFQKGKDYKLYVALTNDDKAKRVAALLVEYYNKTAEYITPAIDASYRHLCPMNLLIFSAMGDAAQLGYRWWNWGGTKLPGQNGVYHFKKRFGGIESKYTYYTQVYGDLPYDVKPKYLLEQYHYFYVLPFSILNGNTRFVLIKKSKRSK